MWEYRNTFDHLVAVDYTIKSWKERDTQFLQHRRRVLLEAAVKLQSYGKGQLEITMGRMCAPKSGCLRISGVRVLEYYNKKLL